MIVEDIIKEARIVWARKGNPSCQKSLHCSGRRKGRLVAKAQSVVHPDTPRKE